MNGNLCLFLVLIITLFKGYKFECKLTDNDLDNCMLDGMFFGSKKSIVPANDEEMSQYCRQMQGAITCMREYSDSCLKDFEQKVSNMIMKNMAVHIEKRCNNPKERSEFIKNVKCFLPKEKMRPLDICSEKHTRYLELASKMEKVEHIPASCCAYQMFRHCIVSESQKLCGDEHSQYWDDILNEVASESVTFSCTVFDCCGLLTAEHRTQFNIIKESNDPSVWAHNYKTPLKLIMDMISEPNL